MLYILSKDLAFPSPNLATKEGLLAVGGDLRPERLLLAYAHGIFPWYSDGDPILWWSPDPRLVLYPDELHISHSLAKSLRNKRYRVTFDTRFEDVVHACSQIKRKREKGTWITREMATAYIDLHNLGYAHSVEVWYQDRLVGGLYGVSLGRCFFGESMFARMSDASKVALVHLNDFSKAHHFDFIDCQLPTNHLIRMGAREVSRRIFLSQLSRSLKRETLIGPWHHPPEM